jgi:hypothetical protein
VLISDLDDDPQDVRRLGAVLLAFHRDGIPLQIVGLDASAEDLALYSRIIGRQAVVHASLPAESGRSRNDTAFPWALVGLALVAAVALAAQELWSPRLTWGRPAA